MIQNNSTSDWKPLRVPFGEAAFEVYVPAHCETLRMQKVPALPQAVEAIQQTLLQPIDSASLHDLIQAKNKPTDQLTACVTVSDITRPVPYQGEQGILLPLLAELERAGVSQNQITILIGNGMHRPSTPEERLHMFGSKVVDRYRIVDHDCENQDGLVWAARTQQDTKVYINRLFQEADVKIVTGLVESHFMAGASGGRKGVCPALVNTQTIERFHGVDFLEHEHATNLVLDGNPCHIEALEVAQTIGVDFLVNVTLNHALELTGVYAGDLVTAHVAAVAAMKNCVTIPIQTPYDIVLTHGGYVGRNHYQCAKAAVGAIPAVKPGGIMILAANNYDTEPVGGCEYKTLLQQLKQLGPDRFVAMLRQPDWTFTKDQWQPEMWAKPLRHVGTEGLYYCAPQLNENHWNLIPATRVELEGAIPTLPIDHIATQCQQAIQQAIDHPKFKDSTISMAFIEDGPYAIPVINEQINA